MRAWAEKTIRVADAPVSLILIVEKLKPLWNYIDRCIFGMPFYFIIIKSGEWEQKMVGSLTFEVSSVLLLKKVEDVHWSKQRRWFYFIWTYQLLKKSAWTTSISNHLLKRRSFVKLMNGWMDRFLPFPNQLWLSLSSVQ